MCTAITLKTKDFYFGRTLDNEFNFNEEVTVTQRNYVFNFKHAGELKSHFAIIGIAFVLDNYPLYYDAVNEKGLCMAGLNFPGNAVYGKPCEGKDNIAQFELIPWVLSQCENVAEARELLSKINITDTTFNASLPKAELHWIIADRDECIVVESVKEGLFIYDNPVGVMTNNPAFPMHMHKLNDYIHLTPKEPKNNFSDKLKLSTYCKGLGAYGLPGDLSSQSRFIRASFTKCNSVSGDDEKASVGQFFHCIGTVEQVRGACDLDNGMYEVTIYTSCCNADKGIYYYTTYSNRQITAVNMHKTNLDGCELSRFPMILDEQIAFQN